MAAISFDFGQTLAELDDAMLAARVAERGASVERERIAVNLPAAWRHYGEVKRQGSEGRDAWTAFMRELLGLSGVRRPGQGSDEVARELAEWLFEQQPQRNLWRKPIAGMFELAQELSHAGIPVAICSNSEGRLAELVAELGFGDLFAVVADSGRLGFEKPDPRIFEYTAQRCGVAARELVHVGDAWEADVRGALDVGAAAVWFRPVEAREPDARILVARSADEVRRALASLGVI